MGLYNRVLIAQCNWLHGAVNDDIFHIDIQQNISNIIKQTIIYVTLTSSFAWY